MAELLEVLTCKGFVSSIVFSHPRFDRHIYIRLSARTIPSPWNNQYNPIWNSLELLAHLAPLAFRDRKTHWSVGHDNSKHKQFIRAQLDDIRIVPGIREQFVQLPQFVVKHKLTVLWTKAPDFRRVLVYFWRHVDRLGKLPSKEQQLSRTQHFTLKAHAAIFVLHIQYGPRGTPLTPMIQRQNFFLSTKVMKQSINQSINSI